jgi:hypothetical protein
MQAEVWPSMSRNLDCDHREDNVLCMRPESAIGQIAGRFAGRKDQERLMVRYGRGMQRALDSKVSVWF